MAWSSVRQCNRGAHPRRNWTSIEAKGICKLGTHGRLLQTGKTTLDDSFTKSERAGLRCAVLCCAVIPSSGTTSGDKVLRGDDSRESGQLFARDLRHRLSGTHSRRWLSHPGLPSRTSRHHSGLSDVPFTFGASLGVGAQSCSRTSSGICPFSKRVTWPQRVHRAPTMTPFFITAIKNLCFANARNVSIRIALRSLRHDRPSRGSKLSRAGQQFAKSFPGCSSGAGSARD